MKIMRALPKATLTWGTQYMLRDYTTATESHKRALTMRQKVLSEDHENTADKYHDVGMS